MDFGFDEGCTQNPSLQATLEPRLLGEEARIRKQSGGEVLKRFATPEYGSASQ